MRGGVDRARAVGPCHTDRRDAERLVRLLIAGELRAVAVPSVEAESLRDLVRAREVVHARPARAR
jgi:transposase